MLRKLRYLIEAFGAWLGVILLRFILPFKYATAFGGWLGRVIGPRCLPQMNFMRLNIKNCFPTLTPQEINSIISEMGDNYGRLLVEYFNPEVFWDGKTLRNIEIRGAEHLKHFFEDGKPGIVFTAHTGNWQMITLAAQSMGYELTQMYRKVTNPWVNSIMVYCQKLAVKKVITKQEGGSKNLLSLLKRGEHILLLVDQKVGEGISVPFLGRNALTVSGWARLSLSQGYPVLPARSERLTATTFRVTFYPPMTLLSTGNRRQDLYDFLLSVNTLIGEWVTERPGQWAWLNRRWKKH